MFTATDMLNLLNAQPFAPFRLHLSGGRSVDVRSREQVLPTRRYAVVAMLDPNSADTLADLHTAIWYMHVTDLEMLNPGAPPLSSPPPSSGDVPSPV